MASSWLFYLLSLWSTLVLSGSLGASSVRKDLNQKKSSHLVNSNSVAVITTPYGDIIDCVPIGKQPAFNHPLLRNVEIQMFPYSEAGSESVEDGDHGSVQESWDKTDLSENCPSGTIPIRRHDTQSAMVYGRKFHGPFSQAKNTTDIEEVRDQHEYATVSTRGEYTGGSATFNVWNPKLESDNEFSLVQLWIAGGSIAGGEWGEDLNTIEVGWQVNPSLYGDTITRLFIYWTGDAYSTTGCYNLLCDGFIQINNKVVLGGPVRTSSYKEKQYAFAIEVFEDSKTQNWWLKYEGKLVGYWPHELFHSIYKTERELKWGGEILNSMSDGRHTTTQMGSGEFPEAGYGAASFIENVQINSPGENKAPQVLVPYTTNSHCYDIKKSGNFYYFGGPGFNNECP